MEIVKGFTLNYKGKKDIYFLRLSFLIYMIISCFFIDRFRFMVLNLTLAYIPMEIAVLLDKLDYSKNMKNKVLYICLFLLWLFFYPNAPYLITDFFHLSVLDYINPVSGYRFTANPYVWKHFCYLSTGIFIGLSMGFVSLKLVYNSVSAKVKKMNKDIFVIVVSLLSSYAIYIGRFLRLHTVHLIIFPVDTLRQMLSVFSMEFWYFMFYMTVIQLVMYFVWKALRK